MQTVHGIITRSIDYQENDKLLNLFTQERGMIFAKAHGAKGFKSEMATASQLFVHGEYIINEKNNKLSFRSAVADELFLPICRDYEKYKVGCAMLMAINTAMNEGERNDECYELLHYALSFLAYSDVNEYDLLSGYLLKLLKFTGFCPSITHCANCGEDLRRESTMLFSNQAGGALCLSCRNTYDAKNVNPLTMEILRRILLLETADLVKIAIPEKAQKQVYSTVINYAEYYFETRLFK